MSPRRALAVLLVVALAAACGRPRGRSGSGGDDDDDDSAPGDDDAGDDDVGDDDVGDDDAGDDDTSSDMGYVIVENASGTQWAFGAAIDAAMTAAFQCESVPDGETCEGPVVPGSYQGVAFDTANCLYQSDPIDVGAGQEVLIALSAPIQCL